MSLPEGVQAVTKPSGKIYYYYQAHRGTDRAGERIPLGSDPRDPRFWEKLPGRKAPKGTPGSFSALILAYRGPEGGIGSPEWERLSAVSKNDYGSYLDRLQASAGDRMVAEMTVADVYQLRDSMQATPHAANHMLAILQMLVKWSIPRQYRKDNPVTQVGRLETDDDGAKPWPEEGYHFVLERAPVQIQRAAFLGRATGQRREDLVRMRPADLEHDGINVRIGKLRDKKHFVPLSAEQMAEIRSWGVADLDRFIKADNGKAMSSKALGSKWDQWRATKAAKPIADLEMTIHGLRASAVVDRRLDGTEDNGIANELGMSVQMVTRYARFADKSKLARASRDRREARVVQLKTGTDLKTSPENL